MVNYFNYIFFKTHHTFENTNGFYWFINGDINTEYRLTEYRLTEYRLAEYRLTEYRLPTT